jgi:hypothetical protein
LGFVSAILLTRPKKFVNVLLREIPPKKVMNIRSVLIVVLISVPALLVISSCATITEGPEGATFSLGKKDPSAESEFRLLSIDIPLTGDLSADVEHWATINFEADPKPSIHRACFNFSGGEQSCVDVQAKDVSYGSHPYFRVPIHVPVGSKKIDCYAEYIRDGKAHRTNTVTYHVIVLKKPEE